MTIVADCRLLSLPRIVDSSGTLTVATEEMPFETKHVFWIHGVPMDHVRGYHAHKHSDQIIVPVSGAYHVTIDDGHKETSMTLDDPHKGLHIPSGIWITFRPLSPESVLLVLSSHPYREDEYIRDYQEFCATKSL